MKIALKNYINLFCLLLLLSLILSCKTTPKKEPENPVVKQPKTVKIEKFYVEPYKFYKDNYGYIGVSYLTRNEIWEKKKILLEKRDAPEIAFEAEKKRLPKEGLITFHIGRFDIMHANTAWYVFSAYKNKKLIFSVKGKEGLPNIKGGDGNWWDAVEIPLDEHVDSKIEIIVKDNKNEKEFLFELIKEEIIVNSP
jgi:hypothetical protein